jgi:drug/metabolite transporter (DMT)-like permease
MMTRRGLALFVALSIIWGLPYLFIKIAVAELDPVITVFARTLPSAILLLLWSWHRGHLRRNLKYWKFGLVFGAVEMVFPWWFISRAEMEISSGLTGLLLATVPLVGVLIAYSRGEKPTGKRLVGLAVGLIGVSLLVGDGSAMSDSGLLAIGMVLLAAVGYAFGPVIINDTPADADSATIIAFSLTFVSLVYLPFAIVQWPAEVPSPPVISAVVVLALVCTVAAFLVFFALVAEIGPMRSTLITYFNPAVAIVLGIVFLDEVLTLGIAVGFPLVLAGSWLASNQ